MLIKKDSGLVTYDVMWCIKGEKGMKMNNCIKDIKSIKQQEEMVGERVNLQKSYSWLYSQYSLIRKEGIL